MRTASPGKQYWEYHFQQQPSRMECEGSSLSAVFEHFALLQRDSWEDIFEILFLGRSSGTEGRQVLFSLPDGWDSQGRGGLGWPDGAVTGEVLIKSCLLRPDFASVFTSGGRLASTWTPHLGLCLAPPRAPSAGGGIVAEANGEGYGGGRPGERALPLACCVSLGNSKGPLCWGQGPGSQGPH